MSLSSEFIDGIYEVYSTFYSSDIVYYPFDKTNTKNIYNENPVKKYLTPVTLVGFPRFEASEPSRVEKIESYPLLLDIPVKSFSLVNITITPDDFSYISNGLFYFKNKYYRIQLTEIGSMINGEVLNYIFRCLESDKNGC